MNEPNGNGRSWQHAATYKNDGKEEQIELGVHEGLEDLLGSELPVLDTGLVDADVLEELNLFLAAQPPSLHGGIGKEEEGPETDGDGQATEHHEHDPPARERGVLADVLEAVRHGATNDLAETETEIPEGEAGSRLGLGVPLAADEEQRGRNGSFEDTKEHTGDEESLVIVGGGTGSGGDTPKDNIAAEPLCGRDLLKAVDCKMVIELSAS